MNLWSIFLELDALYENKDFDHRKKLDEWKLMPANPQGQSQTSTASKPATQSVSSVGQFSQAVSSTITNTSKQSQTTNPTGSFIGPNGKPFVVIVSDQGRLRAMGTDGTNPYAFVAFPNHLRNKEGQIYEVDQLIWNGKNYRAVGNIKPLAVLNANGIATVPTSIVGNQSAASTAKVHKNSKLVIDNYTNNLSAHISELEDENDAEDSIKYFENYPEILSVIQAGSDIIFKLSAEPEDEDVAYWILTYALGEVGNDIAENERYTLNVTEIIISEVDFNAALSNNLN